MNLHGADDTAAGAGKLVRRAMDRYKHWAVYEGHVCGCETCDRSRELLVDRLERVQDGATRLAEAQRQVIEDLAARIDVVKALVVELEATVAAVDTRAEGGRRV